MNKQDLVRELARRADLPQTTTKEVLDAILEEIALVLEEGEAYSHTGFGSFRTEQKKERKSYNPALGKRMILPVSRRVAFRPSDRLKRRVNE